MDIIYNIILNFRYFQNKTLESVTGNDSGNFIAKKEITFTFIP